MAAAAVSLPAFRRQQFRRAVHAPNVILITIDTVRADHIGCYGATEIKTPTLDGLAHDGIVFERAISQVPLTWPSHAAILTGTYPFQNGVQDFTGQPSTPRFRSVAQVFKQQGYSTGAVVSAFVLDRSWGLARGFDFYDDAFSAETFRQKDIGLVDRKAGESVSRALAWLKKLHAARFSSGCICTIPTARTIRLNPFALNIKRILMTAKLPMPTTNWTSDCLAEAEPALHRHRSSCSAITENRSASTAKKSMDSSSITRLFTFR